MSRENLDKWCERGIAGLVLAILVFGPLATGAVRTLEFLVIQGFTIAAMILWAARLWLSPRPQFLWPPVSWLVLLFVAYVVGRYFTSDIEYVARLEMIRVLVYAALFFIIVNNLNRQDHMRLMVLTVVFLAMVIAGYAIYQFATGSQQVWHFTTSYQKRGTGTFISPNNLGGFLGMVLPLALAWTLVSRTSHLTRILVGYASMVIIAGIAVSGSRGAWISTGLVLLTLLILLITQKAHRIPALIMLALTLAGGAYMIPKMQVFQKRIDQLTRDGQLNDGRMDMWRPAVRLWRENLWFGIGPDHFNHRFREYRPESQQRDPDRVHNDYLNTLTDWGIVGAAIVTGALALIFIGAVKTGRVVLKNVPGLGDGRTVRFAIVLGASLGLLAILFHSFTDFNLHIPSNAILAVTLMAMLSGARRFASDRDWVPAGLSTRVLVSTILAACVGYLTWQEYRRGREYVWLAEAHRLQRQPVVPSDRLAESLEKAFAAEPMNFQTAYQIGETLRIQSWAGPEDFEALARQALTWFERSIQLNQHHGYSYLRSGMCLDWLGDTEQSRSYYYKAAELDPNGYFTSAWVGWHYVQSGNFAAARAWLERSRRLEWQDNHIAEHLLPIVTERLLESATNRAPRFGAPAPVIEPFELE